MVAIRDCLDPSIGDECGRRHGWELPLCWQVSLFPDFRREAFEVLGLSIWRLVLECIGGQSRTWFLFVSNFSVRL